MNIKIQLQHPQAKIPTYATPGAACFDLYATEVTGGGDWQTVICKTGIAVEIPVDHAMLIFSRSGHGFKRDIRLANCVGVIDSDYTGEVMVKLRKDSEWSENEIPNLLVRAGVHAIAQACIVYAPQVDFEVVEQLTLTERGDNGFGSTGP